MVTPPNSARWLTGVLAVGASAMVTFASTATYARKETVSGWIVPEGGLVRVAARDGGVIRAIDVHEGETVSLGDTLVRVGLSTDLAQGNAGDLLGRDLAREETAAVLRQRASRRQAEQRERRLELQRDGLVRERAQQAENIPLLEQRVGLAQADLARARDVAEKGFLTRQALDAREGTMLSAQQALNNARTAVAEMDRQIGDLEGQIAELPAELDLQEAESATLAAALAQRRTSLASQSEYLVTSPFAGRVAALPVTLGQAVPAGGAVTVIVPMGARLQAELFLPSRAAGFVEIGQTVRLMYQAFPHQKFGAAEGRVESISPTVVLPSDVTGVSLDEPVFRVKVDLAEDTVSAYGRDMPLAPGMLLSADIVVEQRSLLEWLLDPLFAAGRRL